MALGLLSLSTACGEGSGGVSPRAVEVRPPTGPVVARVNGEAIALEEVRQVCAASGLTPEEALARLVDERVLAQYAEARGYGDLAETRSAVVRARVRALLEESVEGQGPGHEQTAELRGPRLESMIRDLRAKTKVVYDESAVNQALSDDSTLGPGT